MKINALHLPIFGMNENGRLRREENRLDSR